MKFSFPKLSPQLMATLAMLMALTYVLDLFTISVIPNQLQVGVTFIAKVLIGSIAGPWLSALVAIVYDILAFFLNNTGYSFIWGFTLVEALQGFLYGLFFFGKKLSLNNWKDWLYVIVATVITMGIGTFILTPILLNAYYQTPFAVIYATRVYKVLEIPIRVLLIMLVLPFLQRIPEFAKLNKIKN
ncbi:folate family ECF transporter S component [Streptococcus sp. 121]|uniref:folate family ECF transporter S component n=1 Tax=Streptococcus sp. 121 TaxID=2797637 RepID=UPI0018F0A4E8|nr:folate family ECF transporter S component [Streptococcus sp. 121]MBJ6745897.1 folate family ECF transporter S component [Streptococcus sp. 121]